MYLLQYPLANSAQQICSNGLFSPGIKQANALLHEDHAGLFSHKDWQPCPMHRFYRYLGSGSVCWLWGQIQIWNCRFIIGSGNLEPLMKMPIHTAPQVEELKMTHSASKLPCVLPEPQEAYCHHLWTAEDPRENWHTKWDSAEQHSPEKRIGDEYNEMIPDG